MVQAVQASRVEALGPAERIIATLLSHSEHVFHGRPGVVRTDPSAPIGVSWAPVVTRQVTKEGEADPVGARVVYLLPPPGPKAAKRAKKGKSRSPTPPPAAGVRLGVLGEDGQVRDGARVVGRYQEPGLFPEACAWAYRQVAEVHKLDNEFAARWASWAWAQEHKDLKVVLAAFMLVQNRRGDPVMEGGRRVFNDANYRDVGRAMLLNSGARALDAKMVLRVRKLLQLPAVAAVNRELGFGRSARSAFTGAWQDAATSWLRQRERNPGMLAGLLKVGFGDVVRVLVRAAHYKPDSEAFYRALRWEQSQRGDGRFALGLGLVREAGESWEGLDERAVCERIERDRPDWKRVVGLLPAGVGVTRAVMTAAIESGCLSDKDLIIATPTLEELGLLEVPAVRDRWTAATRKAEDGRAAHVSRNVSTQAARDGLAAAGDAAVQRAVAEAARGLRVYIFVDISGSMERSIEQAKAYLARFVQAFPLDKLHVAVFNTAAREIKIAHASAAGVENAFAGIRASGGTDYGAGVRALAYQKIVGANVGADATEDNLFIFVGDEAANDFAASVRATGLQPLAFGLLKVPGEHGSCVTATAAQLGIPCFPLDEKLFASGDAYSVPRALRALIAATPVRQAAAGVPAPKRETLIEQVLRTPLLVPPAWA